MNKTFFYTKYNVVCVIVEFYDREPLDSDICFISGFIVASHTIQPLLGIWNLFDLLIIEVGDNALTGENVPEDQMGARTCRYSGQQEE